VLKEMCFEFFEMSKYFFKINIYSLFLSFAFPRPELLVSAFAFAPVTDYSTLDT